MFVDRIKFPPRRFPTPGFVGKIIIRFVCLDCYREPVPILADRRFNEITAVVVLGHPYLFPRYCHLAAIPGCCNHFGWPIKCGMRQSGCDHVYFGEIAQDLQDRSSRPAFPV